MARPPAASLEVMEIVRAQWGIAVSSLTECASYDDRLWVAEAEAKMAGERYVVKVHNAADSAAHGLLEAQDRVMELLARRGFPVNRPLPLLHCPDCIARLPLGPDGGVHAVRLLTWLPGTLLRDAPAHRLAELAGGVGELLARVDAALLEHEGAGLAHEHDWNLACLPATYARLRPQLQQLGTAAAELELLDVVAAGFGACVDARMRRSIIHGDANEANILCLVPPGGAATVSGLLDFGDCGHSVLACEVAIAMTYQLLMQPKVGLDAAWRAAGALLTGYDRHCTLLPNERAALRVLCCGRLAQSLVLGQCAAAETPSNADYLLTTQQAGGWPLLRRLWGMGDDAFLAALQPPPR